MNADEIADEITTNAAALQFEVTTLAQHFDEQPKFFGDTRNFPHTHYGFLMACMGQIDLMSKCEWGPNEPRGNQTPRMQGFMERYLDPHKIDEHRVAIQLMRHTLMHTGALRYLYDDQTATAYTWRIHFDDTLPTQFGHYTLTNESLSEQPDLLGAVTGPVTIVKALNLRISTFAADIVGVANAYTTAMRADPVLRSKCEAAYVDIRVQRLN